ncbi:MAG: hypothetical protein HN602_02860 [Gammaproteobacteria bacterium]|nr:hypothetical protein [Gammaproteobacteria bacterium]
MLRKIVVGLAMFSVMGSVLAADSMERSVQQLQREWAMILYQGSESEQEAAFEILSQRAHALTTQSPKHAEPLVWEGIILSTYAGAKGGLSALTLVAEARERLQQAEQINPHALNGSVYTSLGSLYYQVPGWPIGFGDDDKAEVYLKRALEINPNGIDPNYFYGDFLIDQRRYKEAVTVLRHALDAPKRPNRPLADAGRRDETHAKLAQAQEQLNTMASNDPASW